MALIIDADCINCEMCEPECPNQAITLGDPIFVIDPARCTECVGHYDTPTCVSVCPIDCISPDPEHRETLDQLADKFVALTGSQSPQ
ncbi:YfhL family 4Fe-4S dicluster ferredoxin [Aestuariibacter halophilus]|uniref:YfhL family 4Fe-4S dicluster ferredoxin n=1 Tax=Fluctibacter halophilus TaxID=226011 RepID=A0ABS8G6Y0_9ALTE|nr:YfhL family 4Fe-4S dicluster ferredoxin [Aestuariibacter halophilus]MCC2616349.1 YfhL family 4Fe-4S dicluster ferredoxin [Aestuariibacter halophilus]